MPSEYRVRWQRVGRNPTYRIYQSWDAACRKVGGLLALEHIRADTARYADMPALLAAPELQIRNVTDWRPADVQQSEASEWDKRHVADWVSWTGGDIPVPTIFYESNPF